MIRWLMAFTALLCLPQAASAEWREAVSRHFIVYSEGSEQSIRQAASDLERYDHVLRLMMDAPDEKSPRLKIYLMRDMAQVQKTMGSGTRTGVAGYYVASPRGSIAVGLSRDTGSSKFDLSDETILYHEYAHHLMMQYFGAVYPTWYVEGFAEYYGMTQILPDGVVEVGHPARHRLAMLKQLDDWLQLKQMLSATNWRDVNGKAHLVYAQGWLLVHYLTQNEARRGQLGRYLVAINRGENRKAAMDAAFGTDATELNRELRSYSRKMKFGGTRITFPTVDIGPIETRTLSKAEAELLRHEIALGRGIYARTAAEFAQDVREIAARYPNDIQAAAVLTEAEYLADNHAAARDAANRWLALAPGTPRALMYRSLIEAGELAESGSDDQKRWAPVLAGIGAALKSAPTDALILESFYDVHAARGKLPPARAQNALYKAMELVPQDNRLRHKVARDFEQRDMIEDAIFAIQPAAFRTHDPDEESEKQKLKRERWEEKWRRAGTEKIETPREMLARLEAKLPPQPVPAAVADQTGIPADAETSSASQLH